MKTQYPAKAVLATVSISHSVLANGQPLPQGNYEVRLTDEWLQRRAEGGQQGMQWVEFLAKGRVAGREAALVIPARQIRAISAWYPASGSSRIDLLKTGDLVRI